MGVPARNAVYASQVKGMQRLVLLAIAEYSQSNTSPFETRAKKKSIAYAAGMSERQAQRYIAQLKCDGVIESFQIDRYQWGYRINLPGVTTDVSPDILEETHNVTPEYPYGVTTDVSPDSPGVTTDVSPNPHRGETSQHRGETSQTALIRNMEDMEEEEEMEEGDARTRDPVSPSLVMSADQTYVTLLTYLEGEVSDHERRTWRERVRAGWAAPDVLCLRGPASLVRLRRFTGCMRMAAEQLGLGAVITFSAIGA